MKKLMLLALAALSVSVAQAITIQWTAANLGTGLASDYYIGVAVISGTVSSSDSQWDLISYDSIYATDYYQQNSANHTLYGKTTMNSNGATYANVGSIDTTDFTGTVSISKDDNTTGEFALVLVNLWTQTYGAVNVTIENWSELDDTDIAYIEVGDLLSGTVTTVSVEAITVPEPTVLALLALGVAGLALKRKVA